MSVRLSEHLPLLAEAPDGIKKLRGLILELAVRGKLVSQDPDDEPASELLKRIAAEKARLVAEGTIRQGKPLAELAEDEIPFELPAGWVWLRLPEVAHYRIGKTPPTKDSKYWSDEGIPWVSISDMEQYGEVSVTSRGVTESAVTDVFKYAPVSAGTLLMSFKLTVGKVSVLGVDAYHNEAIISVTPFKGVAKDFLFRFLPLIAQGGRHKNALMGNTLNSESMAELAVPVPPEAEQHRIVAKVDELMGLCDRMEAEQADAEAAHATLVQTLLGTLTQSRDAAELAASWQRLSQHFDTLFTTEASLDALKQTLLQLAVMGKLVPQDPSDEPASELLKRIAAEKARLVAEGKIRKNTPLAKIKKNEQLFEIPSYWSWARIGDLFNTGSGTTPSRSKHHFFLGGTENWVKTTDLNNAVVTSCEEKITSQAVRECNLSYYPPGTVCIAMYGGGGTIGKSGVLGFPATINQSVFALPPVDGIDIAFTHYYIKSIRNVWMKFAAGLRIAANINGLIIKNMVIPVPPLSEQHRIVAKVDELMALCDGLKADLAESRARQARLAATLIETALQARH